MGAMLHLLRAAFAAVALLAVSLPVSAEEVIHRFDSAVAMAADGSMVVTERISVRAEMQQIRRGIYRDFPLLFEDDAGKTHQVKFDVVSVTRDGKPDTWRVENGARVDRLYIGDPNVFLKPGDHDYAITYRTDRQVRFFPDHDELLWNVNGNAWDFPVEKATAVITLPPGGRIDETVFFTGSYGARGKSATASISADGQSARFETTAPLGPREGLTVGVKFAKGIIAEPTDGQMLSYWLRDNLAEVLAGGGLLAVLAYYLLAWMKVGRDPPSGVIVPRWDAPSGISPALTNYIEHKGFSGRAWTAIAASLLNLAVKGNLVLEDVSSTVRVKPTHAGATQLPTGETALMKVIGARDSGLTINTAAGSTVQSLHSGFVAAMEREHRKAYYHHNTGYVVGGVILSILAILATIILGGVGENEIAAIIPLIFGTVVVSVFGFAFARDAGSGMMGKIRLLFAVAFGFFMLFGALGGSVAAVVAGASPAVVIAAVGLLLVNLAFFYLMGAPTQLGRQMMDGIEGLKTYIRMAEEDRLNLQGAPKMSPQHFETVLPYAVALGLEKPWTNAFQNWLLTAAAAGAAVGAYVGPSWYHGDRFDPGTFGRSMDNLASSIENSLAASMPAPKSSSSGFSGGSGGGGFSGGGGGGGGGGGW